LVYCIKDVLHEMFVLFFSSYLFVCAKIVRMCMTASVLLLCCLCNF